MIKHHRRFNRKEVELIRVHKDFAKELKIEAACKGLKMTELTYDKANRKYLGNL